MADLSPDHPAISEPTPAERRSGDTTRHANRAGGDPLDALRARFREAAETLKRLPFNDMPAPLRALWPETAPGTGVAAAGTSRHGSSLRHIPVAPERIDRLDEVLSWSLSLGPDERRIIWGRALMVPWKVIAADVGLDRTTCWRRYDRALARLALNLARQGGADHQGLHASRVA